MKTENKTLKKCTGVAETCPIGECEECSIRECPHKFRGHYHHDGCGACACAEADEEEEAERLARAEPTAEQVKHAEAFARILAAEHPAYPPNEKGERLTDVATETLLSLLENADLKNPGSCTVFVSGVIPVLRALHRDKIFLKSVIAKHEKNMEELKEAYGVEIVPDPPAEASGVPDTKSLYSLL